MYRILKIEIDDTVIYKKTAAETYVDAFDLMYTKGLINDSAADDFDFIKRDKNAFSESEKRNENMLFLINGSKNLWISTYNETERKYGFIKRVFDKYGINGKVEMIEVNGKENLNEPKMKVKIYDIKSSASANSQDLLSPDGKYYYWNDAQFKGNEVGDIVFFIERNRRWALCTEIKVMDIRTTYNSQTDVSTFNHEYNTYAVSGKYDVFIRFDILEKVEIPSDWNYTKQLGQSEVYDLFKPGVTLTNPDDRKQKIDDLQKIFRDGQAYEILEEARNGLGNAPLNHDIVDAINSPEIQSDLAEAEFHFEKAQAKLIDYQNFEEPFEGFFQKAHDEFILSGKTYTEYMMGLTQGGDMHRYFLTIGQLISYCDINAAGKNELNEYPDKRTLARSFVRQTDWVNNLLQNKVRISDNAQMTPSIRNAINYLENPATGITMLSEKHRAMVSKYLLKKSNYDNSTFVQELIEFFLPYNIAPANPENLTGIIAKILYRYPKVKKLWFERIGGLVVSDNTGWVEDAIDEISSFKYTVLWWDKKPSGGKRVVELLREAIESSDDHCFYIYYTANKKAYARSRIVDFAFEEDYPSKDWNRDNNVRDHFKTFSEYFGTGENGTRKNARIVFLADEIVQLSHPVDIVDFVFYNGYSAPTQNNMQPFTELNSEVEEVQDPNYLESKVDFNRTNMAPRAIISHVHKYMTGKGFQYHIQEISNLYLALKTKPFVILAGISGTGKSQLPKQFAAAVGMKEEQVSLVPVRPDWTDGSELLGYTALDNKFKPQSLTLAIARAAKNPQKPFFFILDEMNLARVEHYFSDFLSVIETRKWSDDGTKHILTQELLRSELLQTAENSEEFRHLRWPDNLYLIGTVNMDETTHAFSRKVLDRANSIEMNDVDLDWIDTAAETVLPLNGIENSFFKTEFIGASDLTNDDKRSIENEMRTLKQVNQILQNADLHFAYRVRDEIAFYLLLNKKLGLMADSTALDFQLVQKVLPRIHGSSERIQTVLIELLNLLEGTTISTSNFQFSNAESKVNVETLKYRRSSRKILFMLKRFDDDRFTSFWL